MAFKRRKYRKAGIFKIQVYTLKALPEKLVQLLNEVSDTIGSDSKVGTEVRWHPDWFSHGESIMQFESSKLEVTLGINVENVLQGCLVYKVPEDAFFYRCAYEGYDTPLTYEDAAERLEGIVNSTFEFFTWREEA